MDRPLLVNEFEEMGLSISDDILDECIIVCHTYRITPSDLVGSWIAYCASSQIDANDLNKDKLMILVKSFKIDTDNNKNSFEKKSNSNNVTSSSTVHSLDSSKSTTQHRTNIIKIENEICISDIIDGNIKEEENSSTAGDIACDFGLENVNKNDSSVDVEISFFKQDLFQNFIFGRIDYQKYEHHVQELVGDICKNNNLQAPVPLSELFCTNDNEITIAGTLKLIKKDLFLMSPFGCIKLDLSEAGQLSKLLFANQILVVTGTNPDSKVFKVRKLYTNSSLPLLQKPPAFSQGNVNMIVAAGPFFSESSPHGKLLKSLIEKCIELEAKLIVLFGPIFETDFGMQLNKTSSESLQNCYDEVLEAIIKPLFNNPNTQNTKLVIFSSWKDTNNYGFYPTPPFTESRLPTLYPNNVFMVSDPTIFSANNIIIAGNTSDTLMGLHISGINQIQEETFEKLAKQIVWQRSLCPSYTASPTIPVDQDLWLEHCNFEEITPHIILTSSQLRSFIRVVENSMIINVGQLVKSNSQKKLVSGTYCKIQISAPKDGQWLPKTNISAQVIHI